MFQAKEFFKTECGKDIKKLLKEANKMDVEIISIRVPQKYMMREEFELTYPEQFLGIYICEHEELLKPNFTK